MGNGGPGEAFPPPFLYVNESNRILKAYSLPNASDHHALTLAIRLTCTGEDQCLGLKNTDKKPRNAFS